MSICRALICFSFSLITAACALAANGSPLKVQSATLGQVGGTIITSRDVQISSIMDHWFLLSKRTEKPTGKAGADTLVEHKDWMLDPKTPSFQKQLSTVMAEHLVMSEAENFAVAQLPATEVQRVAKQMEEDLKTWPEWNSLEVGLAELEINVGRHLRSKEFLKFKTESMGMQVSDEEAKKYYDQNRSRFNNLPFEGFKESIKEYLISRDIEAKMKDWFDVLRKKYKVKMLPYESES